jgi:serine/threonine protein kinase
MVPEKIGRYEIKSELGRGGMAAVYLASDPRFKREVAIKILPPQLLSDPVYRARFEREAQMIAALEHPAIVPVYDYGEEDGQLYLVMRYMPGGSLADKLKNGTLPPTEIVHIIARITSALDQVHARGIIHRDLKPGNILFDQYSDAYLSDFGIARLTEATTTLTGAAIVGTPAYMSPEQARGDTDIDGRADLYAVGAIIFQMLSGKLPYESTTPLGLAMKHITEPVPSIVQVRPDLPPTYDRVIETAMAKDPAQRFQTGHELSIALDTVTKEITAPPPPTAPPVTSPGAVARPSTPPPLARVTPPPADVSPGAAAQPSTPPPFTPVTPPPLAVSSASIQKPKQKARLPWFVFAAGGLVLLAICALAVFAGGMAAGLWGTSKPAQPTAVYVHPMGTLPYLDQFNNPNSGWPTYSGDNGQSGYVSDGYKIQVDAPDQQIIAVPGQLFSDIVIEITATQVTGPEDAYYGALCRYKDDQNYYYFIVGSDGYYSIGKIAGGANFTLSETNTSQAILPATNQNFLRAECNSDTLSLSANDQMLTEVHDSDFTIGDVGLLAGTLNTPVADIRFTYFYVTQP